MGKLPSLCRASRWNDEGVPRIAQAGRRTPIVVAAVVAVAAHVSATLLLRATLPYLGVLDLVATGVVGSAFAIGAIVVGAHPDQWRLAWALVAVAFATAAAPLSLGLAQVSAAWVAVGALAACAGPASFYATQTALRGDEAGRAGRIALWFASAVAGVTTVTVTLTVNPAAWGWCGCLSNPFAVAGTARSYPTIDSWLTGLHLAAVVTTVIALVIELLRRPGRAGTAVLLVAGYSTAAAAWAAADILELVPNQIPPTWLLHVATAGLLIILVSALSEATRRRPSRAHVADLLLAARERRDAATLNELVARALGDPGARVLWWDAGDATFRDHTGAEASIPVGTPVLQVSAGGAPLASVVPSTALPADQSLLDSVAEALRLAAENQRLTTELERSLAEVRESRTRILTTADETRRRIERDLHDGAQRLLVSTGLQLNLAQAQAADDPKLAGSLARASEDLSEALAELRRLARGITPAVLVHSRLRDAIEELTMSSPIPATLKVTGDTEPGESARTAIYFVAVECLTNAAKHSDATAVQVELTISDAVRITVRDNGRGGAEAAGGTGLRGLVDRLSALGGTLDVASNSSGTTVIGSLPAGAT